MHFSIAGSIVSRSYTGNLLNKIEQTLGFSPDIELSYTYKNFDLSPIIIDILKYKSLKLRAKKSIAFLPFYDKSSKYYILRNEEINIYVYARTRKELIEELQIQIAFLWREYVLAKDETLDEGAQALKDKLKSSFEER